MLNSHEENFGEAPADLPEKHGGVYTTGTIDSKLSSAMVEGTLDVVYPCFLGILTISMFIFEAMLNHQRVYQYIYICIYIYPVKRKIAPRRNKQLFWLFEIQISVARLSQ